MLTLCQSRWPSYSTNLAWSLMMSLSASMISSTPLKPTYLMVVAVSAYRMGLLTIHATQSSTPLPSMWTNTIPRTTQHQAMLIRLSIQSWINNLWARAITAPMKRKQRRTPLSPSGQDLLSSGTSHVNPPLPGRVLTIRLLKGQSQRLIPTISIQGSSFTPQVSVSLDVLLSLEL